MTSTSGDEADGLATIATGVGSSTATAGSSVIADPVSAAGAASAMPAAATSSSSDVMPSIPGIDGSLDSVKVTRESSTKYRLAYVRMSSAVSVS